VILSNVEIHAALDARRLIINPEPTPRTPTLSVPECPYGTTSVDLRLGQRISIPPRGGPFTYDLRKGGIARFLAEASKHIELDPRGGYALQPNDFVLGQTFEYLELPIIGDKPALAARIEGKSSFARCGLLVHFTAPTVHAGFKGTLTLEMKNLGNSPITLYPEMPICQLIVEVVAGTPVENPGQFQGQTTPPGAR